MSLELAIQANTAAINQLIAVMNKRVAFDIDTPAIRDVMTVAHVSGERSIQDDMEAAVSAEVVGDEEAFGPSPATDEPAKPLNYEADVLPVLHKFLVAKGGRTAADKLLKKYGVDKFSKVPADQLGSLLADLQAEMSA